MRAAFIWKLLVLEINLEINWKLTSNWLLAAIFIHQKTFPGIHELLETLVKTTQKAATDTNIT